jgi:hypothetical protein
VKNGRKEKRRRLRREKKKRENEKKKLAANEEGDKNKERSECTLWKRFSALGKKKTTGEIDVEEGVSLYENIAPSRPEFDDDWRKVVEEEVRCRMSTCTESIPPLSTEEVREAIRLAHQKSLSAPGDDQVMNILFVEELVEPLKIYINFILFSNTRPSSHITKMIYIPKDVPTHDVKLMRPLSLFSNLSKLTERALRPRIRQFIKFDKHQFAFQKGTSGVELLGKVVDRVYQRNSTYVSAAMMDIVKAYDSLWILGLLYKCIQKGLPMCYVCFLFVWLSNRIVYVVDSQGRVSRKICTNNGLPQGSVLSCDLWNVYIDDLPCEVREARVESYLFADDVACIPELDGARGDLELQKALDAAASWSNRWRLVWSGKKSVVMCFGKNDARRTFTLYGEPLEYVPSFKYVGLVIEECRSWDCHWKMVWAKVQRLRWCLLKFWHTAGVCPAFAAAMVRACIGGSVGYGWPVWAPSKEEFAMLDRHVASMLSTFVGLPWNTGTDAVLVEFGLFRAEVLWDYSCVQFVRKLAKDGTSPFWRAVKAD